MGIAHTDGTQTRPCSCRWEDQRCVPSKEGCALRICRFWRELTPHQSVRFSRNSFGSSLSNCSLGLLQPLNIHGDQRSLLHQGEPASIRNDLLHLRISVPLLYLCSQALRKSETTRVLNSCFRSEKTMGRIRSCFSSCFPQEGSGSFFSLARSLIDLITAGPSFRIFHQSKPLRTATMPLLIVTNRIHLPVSSRECDEQLLWPRI